MTYFAPMFSPKQQHSKYKANATHISLCAKGKHKTSGGFKWKYRGQANG